MSFESLSKTHLLICLEKQTIIDLDSLEILETSKKDVIKIKFDWYVRGQMSHWAMNKMVRRFVLDATWEAIYKNQPQSTQIKNRLRRNRRWFYKNTKVIRNDAPICQILKSNEEKKKLQTLKMPQKLSKNPRL